MKYKFVGVLNRTERTNAEHKPETLSVCDIHKHQWLLLTFFVIITSASLSISLIPFKKSFMNFFHTSSGQKDNKSLFFLKRKI